MNLTQCHKILCLFFFDGFPKQVFTGGGKQFSTVLDSSDPYRSRVKLCSCHFFYKTYFSLSFSFKCDIFHVCLNMEIGMSYLMRNQPKFFFNQETETYIKRYEASNNGYRSRRMYRGAVSLILFRHCPSEIFRQCSI